MFSPEFKLQVLKEAEAEVLLAELCRHYELTSGMIYKKKRSFKENKDRPFLGKGSRNTEKARIAQLERLIGRQVREIGFLKSGSPSSMSFFNPGSLLN